MRLLMQSVLPSIRTGSGRRALIYDAKQDVISILSGMKVHCPVVILNPLDVRSAAWEIAVDVNSPAIALQVAHAFNPDEQGYNAFFVKAARDLMAAVFMALHLSRPGRWTLADVLLILSDTNRAAKLCTVCRRRGPSAANTSAATRGLWPMRRPPSPPMSRCSGR